MNFHKSLILITVVFFSLPEIHSAALTSSTIIIDNTANDQDLTASITSPDTLTTYASINIPKRGTKNVVLTHLPIPGDYTLLYSVPGVTGANGSQKFKMTNTTQTIVLPTIQIPLPTATIIINNGSNGGYRVNVELTAAKDYKQKFSTETTVPGGGTKAVQLSNIIIPGTYSLYYYSPDVSGGGGVVNVTLTKDGQVIAIPYSDFSYYEPGGY